MATQLTFITEPPQSFGTAGKRAWFWQDQRWQVGKAWKIEADGRVLGMCRDYGTWGGYTGREPMQTHGTWKPDEVSWKRPADQYEGPMQP